MFKLFNEFYFKQENLSKKLTQCDTLSFCDISVSFRVTPQDELEPQQLNEELIIKFSREQSRASW